MPSRMNTRRSKIIICILHSITLLCSVKAASGESQKTGISDIAESDKVPVESAKPTVSCDRDTIIIAVPRESVRSPASGKIVSPKYIMFRTDASDHCRAQKWDEVNYRISINAKSNFLCGSKETREDYQIIYENEVVWLDVEAGRIWSLINITCHYNDEDHVVFLPDSSREAKMKTNEGDSLDIKMNIFRDKSFSESQKFTSKIPPISVGHFIFVSVDVILPDSDKERFRDVRIVCDTCYASYFPSWKDKTMIHTFITKGCADNIDSTVVIDGNGVGFSSRWKFQMFKWVNTSNQRVYLFCEVFLCEQSHVDNALQCDMNVTKSDCYGKSKFSSKRSRRQTIVSSSRKEPRGYVAVGPIFPKDSVYLLDIPRGNVLDQFSNGSENYNDAAGTPHAIPIAVGVVFGIIIVILVVAGYLIRNSSKKNPRRDKGQMQIEQGFAFAMKSSRDPKISEDQKIPHDKDLKKTESASDKTSGEEGSKMENKRKRKRRKKSRRNYDSEGKEIHINYRRSLSSERQREERGGKVRINSSTVSFRKEIGGESITSREKFHQECERTSDRVATESSTYLTTEG